MLTKVLLRQTKDGWFIVFEKMGVALHLKDDIEWQKAMQVTKAIEDNIQGVYLQDK
ncbi:MAG: hypothetical protein MI740_05195 [Halanaerobiales bacterium]|nr:hypothetical protein [Halanaerobiales bacterium]